MTARALTIDDLIALWRRVFPRSYTVPIEEEQGGQGFDMHAGAAAVFAAASEAVALSMQEMYLREHAQQTRPPAAGAARATTTIQITRLFSTVGDLNLREGTRLRAQQLGTRGQVAALPSFELAEDVLMPEGDRGPIEAPVRATYVGSTGNVRAGTIVAFETLGRASVTCVVTGAGESLVRVASFDGTNPDRFNRGMLGRFVTIVGAPSGIMAPRQIVIVRPDSVVVDPPLPAGDIGATVTVQVAELEDLGLVVEHEVPATGGLFGTLDELARDRSIGRVTGEVDDQLRERIADMGDVVSPAAIVRIAQKYLTDAAGIPFLFLETRDVQSLKGFVWDLDAFDFGSVSPIAHVPGSELVGQGAVMLSDAQLFRFFILLIGYVDIGDFGFAWDSEPDPPLPPDAWDVMAWDGYPVDYYRHVQRVYAAVEAAREGGVAWRLIRDFDLV